MMPIARCSSRLLGRRWTKPFTSNIFVSKFGVNQRSVRKKASSGVVKATTSIIEEKLERKFDVFAEDLRPVILFDGVCNFCNAGVNLVLDFDQNESFRFAALQSDVGKELLKQCNRNPDDISSMVVVEKNAFYVQSDAALKIAERLRLPLPFLAAFLWPIPKPIRDRSYDWIAENRYKILGIRDECRLSDPKAAKRFLS